MSSDRVRRLLTLAVLALGAAAGRADDSHKTAEPVLDDELLEFLGSVDPASDSAQSDDGAWIEYLSQTDIGKAVKPASPPSGSDAKPAAPAGNPLKPSASLGRAE
jgi:hypothetical protein